MRRYSLGPNEQVRALLVQWQMNDSTPVIRSIPAREGETPTQALFRKWAEEDANLTEDEQREDEKLWQEFRESVDNERAKAGMRRLF